MRRRAKPRLAAFAKSWGEKPLRCAGIYNRAATARSATQAAIRAGYSPNSAAQIGHENLRKPEITLAIQEALRQFGGITQTRLIDELGRLAFSDIGNVVAWDNDVEHVSIAAFGGPKGEAAGVTKMITFRVTVLPSAKIDPAARAAVASISQGVGGELRIKMHDKIPAIDKLARVLGMYRVKVDVLARSLWVRQAPHSWRLGHSGD
jgi:phage terminase small subunit